METGQLELVKTFNTARRLNTAGDLPYVRSAVRSKRPELLAAVIHGKPSQPTVVASVEEVVRLKDIGLVE